MEKSGHARISFSLTEGRFEIEGDVDFVTNQIDRFEDLLRVAFIAKGDTSTNAKKTDAAVPPPSASGPASIQDFENLFAVADGKVQVLKTMPGNSTSEKMVSAGLLLAFANECIGQSSTTFDAIRLLCKSHGCLDGANFSKRLKAEKSWFVFSGGPKSQTLSLTVPGKKHADQVARSLNAA